MELLKHEAGAALLRRRNELVLEIEVPEETAGMSTELMVRALLQPSTKDMPDTLASPARSVTNIAVKSYGGSLVGWQSKMDSYCFRAMSRRKKLLSSMEKR